MPTALPRGRRAAGLALVTGAALACLVAVPAAASAAEEERPPKRVLVLDSFGRDFSPYNEFSPTFRTELARLWKGPIEFVEFSLESVAFEAQDTAPALAYLRTLQAERPPDLVVTNAGPAAAFWLRNREALAPGRPTLLGAVEERYVARLRPNPDELAGSFRLFTAGILRDFLDLRPQTTEVLVVFGASPLERFWAEQVKRDWAPFRDRVRLSFTTDLPFDEVVERSSRLPASSAIFLGLMLRDAAGIPHELKAALRRLHAAASAPIFSWSDHLVGIGTVGGRVLRASELGSQTARAAAAILAGERTASIRFGPSSAMRPVFDGRELHRWGIDESRLPPESEVRFRPPSFLQEYRWHILAALGVIVAQGVGIAALLEGRRRQRRAEQEALRLRDELAHAGRVTVMGQLASSLAHELAQPLGAILRNAEAAELFLGQLPPDLTEVRAIVADIRNDDHRAAEVISRMRGLLKRRELKAEPVDVGKLVEDVVGLVRPDAQARGVEVELDLARDLPPVRGDDVHIQQVLLNLFVNAMDAMDGSPAGRKRLSVGTRASGPGAVEIAVGDTGPGIPGDDLPRLFEPFFTTKKGGMGMGLPICRTLVEAHGGTVEAESRPGGGALFRVRLPAGAVPA